MGLLFSDDITPAHQKPHNQRGFPGQQIILDMLIKIEVIHEHQNLLRWKFNRLLETGSGHENLCLSRTELAELRRAWGEFIQQGGVTAGDLRRFLRGEQIGDFRPIQRGHLRLARSSTALRRVLTQPSSRRTD